MKKRYFIFGMLAGIVIVIDQLAKFIITHTIPIYGSVPVINGFFNLVHIYNRGIAFGLMNQPGNDITFYVLTLITIGAIIGLIIWYSKLKNEGWKVTVSFSFILGGAVGNLVDRLYFKRVIDFLDFYIGSYHWPAFNIADSAITIGTCVLAYILFLMPCLPKQES